MPSSTKSGREHGGMDGVGWMTRVKSLWNRSRGSCSSLASTSPHRRTAAYTLSASLRVAICRGLFEMLTWPYSTSWGVVCGTCLSLFRMFTSAYVNSCASSTWVEPWSLCRFLCTQTNATASTRRKSSTESTVAITVKCATAGDTHLQISRRLCYWTKGASRGKTRLCPLRVICTY